MPDRSVSNLNRPSPTGFPREVSWTSNKLQGDQSNLFIDFEVKNLIVIDKKTDNDIYNSLLAYAVLS